MPKQITSAEWNAILDAVSQIGDGASAAQIGQKLGSDIPRRTLQRRLTTLVAEQRLIRTGLGPASRYQLPSSRGHGLVEGLSFSARPLPGFLDSIISPEGNQVRKAVRLPIEQRQPVGYRRKFLDDYRPNVTSYLSADIRQHLADWGKSPEGIPAGTYVRQILNRLLIDLSWNSSRLEGNTYSLLETQRLIELGEAADEKDAAEAQMILNHKSAIEMLVDGVSQVGFDRHTILNLHALLSENLLGDPAAGGRLRTTAVDIGGSVFHPLEVPQLIEECFDQVLNTAAAVLDPFEQSFFVMVHLPYLQPFIDVNKRVSRLAANIPFIKQNFCPLSFLEVSSQTYTEGILGIYELNRIELFRDLFVWAYKRSANRYSAIRQSLGEPDHFRIRYRENLRSLIQGIVLNKSTKKQAGSMIREYAASHIALADRAKFMEAAETELMSLHEGNFARYRIRPFEFAEWQAIWR